MYSVFTNTSFQVISTCIIQAEDLLKIARYNDIKELKFKKRSLAKKIKNYELSTARTAVFDG